MATTSGSSPLVANLKTQGFLESPQASPSREAGRGGVWDVCGCTTTSPVPALFDRPDGQSLLCSLCASFLLVPSVFDDIVRIGIAFKRSPEYLDSAAKLCSLCSLLVKLRHERQWDSYNAGGHLLPFGLKGTKKSKLGGCSILLSITMDGCSVAEFWVISIDGLSITF